MGNDSDAETIGTLFRDVVLSALFGILLVLVMVVAHINPVATNDDKDADPPGTVVVEAYWPDDYDTDVDLWVQGPGDVPVGYSNKGGVLFNLLRDDLGTLMDISGRNYENAYTRGVKPGGYTVNVHLFRNRSGQASIPVRLVVSTRASDTGRLRQILVTDLTLDREGQEKTAFRFSLQSDGNLVPDSLTTIFKPLRSGSK